MNQTVNKAGNGFWYQPNQSVPIGQVITIVFDDDLGKSIEYVPYSETGTIQRSLLFMGMEFTSLQFSDVSNSINPDSGISPGRVTIFTLDNPDFSIRSF